MVTRIYQLGSAGLSRLIALAQADSADDSTAMNQILQRFEPLTRRLARGLTASRNDLYDDVANACRSGLVRAVRRHDPTRVGFPAYAERFMRGAGLRELKRWQRSDVELLGLAHKEGESVGNPDSANEVDDQLAPWGDGVVAEAISDLTPSQRRIAELRYVHDAPLDLIASEAGTSVSAVSQRLSTIHRKVELALVA
jgi:RNA polymerase sigma factor (sigma-70 family)